MGTPVRVGATTTLPDDHCGHALVTEIPVSRAGSRRWAGGLAVEYDPW